MRRMVSMIAVCSFAIASMLSAHAAVAQTAPNVVYHVACTEPNQITGRYECYYYYTNGQVVVVTYYAPPENIWIT